MNDNIFHNGQDTGLNWKDAPEWANVMITNCSSFIWAESFGEGSVKCQKALGGYGFDSVNYCRNHHWILVSTRPQEEPWQVGDELEFLGGKQYFHTGFFIKGETYTIGDILDSGYNLNRGSYSAFWCTTTIRKCFKRINKTEEEQKVTKMKSVRDVDHLEELMNNGKEVFFGSERVLSFMRKPKESYSSFQYSVFTDVTGRCGVHTDNFKYKPTKIRRFYQTGDRKEDIIRVNDHDDKIVALYDLSTDYPDADYPVTLGIVRETGGKFFNTFNKDQIIVEVEE